VKKANRTFRVDRILTLIDIRTGLIADGMEKDKLLARHVFLADAAEDRKQFVQIQREVRQGVFILLDLAMRDGRLHGAERNVC
jgi:hypothetical protein